MTIQLHDRVEVILTQTFVVNEWLRETCLFAVKIYNSRNNLTNDSPLQHSNVCVKFENKCIWPLFVLVNGVRMDAALLYQKECVL